MFIDPQRDLPGDDGRRGADVRGAAGAAAGRAAAGPAAGALLRRRPRLPAGAAQLARRAGAHRHPGQ